MEVNNGTGGFDVSFNAFLFIIPQAVKHVEELGTEDVHEPCKYDEIYLLVRFRVCLRV